MQRYQIFWLSAIRNADETELLLPLTTNQRKQLCVISFFLAKRLIKFKYWCQGLAEVKLIILYGFNDRLQGNPQLLKNSYLNI